MDEQQVERASHIASLIVKQVQDTLTDKEWQELQAWTAESRENYSLYEELTSEEGLSHALDELQTVDTDAAYQKLSDQLFYTAPVEIDRPRKLWRYWAAAVLVLAAGAVTWYTFFNKPEPVARLVVHAPQQQVSGSNNTVLILGNGSAIPLNAVPDGLLAEDGKVQIKKLQPKQVEYQLPAGSREASSATGTTALNTLQTARGDQYGVVLPDGTRVWLNAASTLQYPSVFAGPERRVILSGEGYFDVAKWQQGGEYVPFIVSTGNMEVKALGTDFNIKAYKEEDNVQTTLISGLVKLSLNQHEYVLRPGKKASTKNNSDSIRIEDANIELALAWKNGQFVFRNTPLSDIMKQLTRWYDMDVQYTTKPPRLFITGEINRDATIDSVLKMLEYAGDVHFEIQGKTIQVMGTVGSR
jgi:transmembrane sensor